MAKLTIGTSRSVAGLFTVSTVPVRRVEGKGVRVGREGKAVDVTTTVSVLWDAESVWVTVAVFEACTNCAEPAVKRENTKHVRKSKALLGLLERAPRPNNEDKPTICQELAPGSREEPPVWTLVDVGL
jgi:hypothetical protein